MAAAFMNRLSETRSDEHFSIVFGSMYTLFNWVFHYRSRNLIITSLSQSNRPHTERQSGNTVFWDAHVVVLIDYQEKGKTIIKEYYAAFSEQLRWAFKNKRRHLKAHRFYHDNAPTQKSIAA